MGKPFASVLIDTYNHERFIEQAIVSVLEQDFPASDREILVVDDGSTDGTPEIVRKFAPQVRLLRKENGGQASAFNAGIPECQGEVVAFLDGDDWWAPGKLATVTCALASNATVGLIGHSVTESYRDGKYHTEVLRENTTFRIDSEGAARSFRVRKNFLGTSRMTYRSSLLREIGSVPEVLRIEADEYLFTLGAFLSDVLILREPLTFYRLHESNAFQLADGTKESIRRKQRILEALRDSIRTALVNHKVSPKLANIILDWIGTEARQLRLSLDPGFPWETISTELQSYGVMYQHASLFRLSLKCLSLLPACFMSSRSYYALLNRLATNETYRKARKRWLPFSEPAHVERFWTTRP